MQVSQVSRECEALVEEEVKKVCLGLCQATMEWIPVLRGLMLYLKRMLRYVCVRCGGNLAPSLTWFSQARYVLLREV